MNRSFVNVYAINERDRELVNLPDVSHDLINVRPTPVCVVELGISDDRMLRQ